jgi:cytidine deaminase
VSGDAALTPEDAKIVTLARSARLRAYVPHGGLAAAEGAAVRDTDGRTYAAATVENADPALTTSALRAAVAAAASSGARSFEAAAVVSAAVVSAAVVNPAVVNPAVVNPAVVNPAAASPASFDAVPAAPPAPADLAVLAEFGRGVPVLLAGPDGVLRARTET